MSELDYVGKSVLRKDGPDKVTGRALYTVDINLPGTLVGRILRSPHAHARIVNIDTSKAKRVNGVKAVVTHQDTHGVRHGFVETPRYPADQDCLAEDRVRFVGEEVAAFVREVIAREVHRIRVERRWRREGIAEVDVVVTVAE